MAALIEDYRNGGLSLSVPLILAGDYARRFGIAYLEGQVYFELENQLSRNRV